MFFEIPLQPTLIIGQTVWLVFRPILLSGIHKKGSKVGIKLFAGDDVDLPGLRGVLGDEELSEIAESRLSAANGLLVLLPAELCRSLILLWKREKGKDKRKKQWVCAMRFSPKQISLKRKKRKKIKLNFTKSTGKHHYIPVMWLKSQLQFHKWCTRVWHKTQVSSSWHWGTVLCMEICGKQWD